MSDVKISSTGVGANASIEVDGRDMANVVRAYDIRAEIGRITEVRLEIVARKVLEYQGDAYVRMNADFEAFLEGLGWTPPPRP